MTRFSSKKRAVAYRFMSVFILLLTACSSSPPSQTDSLCGIFREMYGWYDNAKEAQKRWGMPIPIQMAILRQESRFISDALPPRDYLLGFIPWGRKSSAYGYAQALDATWDSYRKKSGNSGADRDDFADAVDFVAWYGRMSHRLADISRSDTYHQYLAYHEGHGGFKRGTYNSKPWLIKVARKVEANAKRYEKELSGCREELESSGWWPF